MTRLRILHAVPSLNPEDGGPARSVPALAAAQATLGADVVVCSRQPATIDLSKFQPCRFSAGDVLAYESHPWRPDLVHDHGLWLGSNHSSARLSRHLRIPRVVSPRGMLEPWCLNHRRLKKTIAWQFYQHRDLRSTTCLHATSESEAVQFRKLGFDQPITRLPNGVDLPNQKSLTAGAAKPEIVFLGRIHPVKGLKHLLDAWAQVNRPGWTLRIVGADEDQHLSQLKKHPIATSVAGNVQFCPPVHSAEKWKLLADAAAVVLPSFSENFGIVAAEALACGTPVVASTGTPWSGLVSHGCGWHVAPNGAAFATAMHAVMGTSRAELDAMGQRGRQWMQSEFSWDQIAGRMLQTYDWLLGRTSAPIPQIRTVEQQRAA